MSIQVSPRLTAIECSASLTVFEMESAQHLDLHEMVVTEYLGSAPAQDHGYYTAGATIIAWAMDAITLGSGYGRGVWGGQSPAATATVFTIAVMGNQLAQNQHLRMYFAGTLALDVTINVIESLHIPGVPEEHEENPGIYMHVNLDSDNGTDRFDYGEDHTIPNENDLVRVDIALVIPTTGTVTLSRTGMINVWNAPTKGTTPTNGVLYWCGLPEEFKHFAPDEKVWDLSIAAERTAFSALATSGIFVEGAHHQGDAALTLTLKDAAGAVISTDTIAFHLIAAVCADQPAYDVRQMLRGLHPNLIDCEWSVTGDNDPNYNCIAWTVGETNTWYRPETIAWGYGEKDGVLSDDDWDDFYFQKSNGTLRPTASGQWDAKVIVYSGFHAAIRKSNCICGAGQWIMFESKLGVLQRIEHVWDQVNSPTYGAPRLFYKENQP